MFFLSYEILFVIIYFCIRLYFVAGDFIIFSKTGTKLKKYILENDMQNTTFNFGNAKSDNFHSKNNFLFNKLNINSPIYKQVVVSLLITLEIIAIILALRYDVLFSNFIPIHIFIKQVDIVSFFGQYYLLLRNIYFLIYIILIFDITIHFVRKTDNYLLNKKLSKNNVQSLAINESCIIGEIQSYDITNKKNEIRKVSIERQGLYQNVLITGSIGSGKTTTAITNILEYLIKNNIGGLVIDIKGNFYKKVEEIARHYKKEDKVKILSMNTDIKYNPLAASYSNVEIASMLKKVLNILSNGKNSESFWLDKAESYLRDFITIIKIYKEYVDFSEIHRLVTDNEYLLNTLKKVKENIFKNQYQDEELFGINNAICNIKNEYLKLDERTLNIIKAEISRITSLFVTNYNIYSKFCKSYDNLDFYKNIVVLSLNIGENKVLTQTIAAYLKLDFQKQVLGSKYTKDIFFMCDEYQEIANFEDANFFSLSREYKCINIVSMQSYTSLINNIKDENSSKVIIQNLVNKIWFRSDDNYTINQIVNQIGKEERKYKNINVAENGQNTRYSFFRKSFFDYKTSISQSLSYNYKLDDKLTSDYINVNLKTFEAICLLSNGTSMEYFPKVNLLKKERFFKYEN